MIDTIGIQFRIRLHNDVVEHWETKRMGGRQYEQLYKRGKHHFYAVYYPICFSKNDPRPILNIYVSLPKFIHGCNHVSFNFSMIKSAIAQINNVIKSFPEFSELVDLDKAKLIRFDVCENFDVGSDVEKYLEVIKRMEYPHKKKTTYTTGCQFKSSEMTITFYDKFQECHHIQAKGKLRVEVSVKRANKVKEVLHKDFPTVNDLSQEILVNLLQEVLFKLNLSKEIICSESEAEYRINSSTVISSRTIRKNLINFLRDNQRYESARIKEHYSPPTIRKYRNILRKVNISPQLINEPRILPPLKLIRKIFLKVLLI